MKLICLSIFLILSKSRSTYLVKNLSLLNLGNSEKESCMSKIDYEAYECARMRGAVDYPFNIKDKCCNLWKVCDCLIDISKEKCSKDEANYVERLVEYSIEENKITCQDSPYGSCNGGLGHKFDSIFILLAYILLVYTL